MAGTGAVSDRRTRSLLERFARDRPHFYDPLCLLDLGDCARAWLALAGNDAGYQRDMGEIDYAFSDGGLTGRNGDVGTMGTFGMVLMRVSPSGDVWTFVRQACGLVAPHTFRMGRNTVTNNQSEMYALFWTLCRLPEGWSGTLVLDSQNTIQRVNNALEDRPSRGDAFRLKDQGTLRELLMRVPEMKLLHTPGSRHSRTPDPVSMGNDRCDKLAVTASLYYRWMTGNKEWARDGGVVRTGLRDQGEDARPCATAEGKGGKGCGRGAAGVGTADVWAT